MNDALKILVKWAELQLKDIALGVPFKDVQAYEKLHSEQFEAWCKANNVGSSIALQIFGFKGVTSKKETAILHYQAAAKRARQWLDFSFEPCFQQHANLTIRPVVTVVYDGKTYTEEAAEHETPEMWSLYATERKSCLTYCFADLDTEDTAKEFAALLSEIHKLPLIA
ncbi:hypothetical protein KAM448_35060 [Aeromonas caviae]|uniref:Uncharacterized protein n=1 Tax=Aeromonas caviae TaxID=648 RepID=A0ABD0B8R6_AERCA|nr:MULTISPECIES: hypothetical protein [Aeromonas]BCK65821.1 hypothetical protein KAM330_48100 [Aeromonas hydrophila]BCR31411.1 hypothetical protein KAM376_44170 [Aeromonas caviae]GJA71829.1 hypothetical protein KAM353_14760 [Aeromonas caviae]GJA81699.1 hypothetical protein KAM355_22590 [Aeromonas caviae]GJB00726.1 hypothetical protein KAM359_41330 [Aeromonas caviae]